MSREEAKPKESLSVRSSGDNGYTWTEDQPLPGWTVDEALAEGLRLSDGPAHIAVVTVGPREHVFRDGKSHPAPAD